MTLQGPAEQLAHIHTTLWDEPRGLVLVPPGATPGLDLSSLGLHSVRESALGAYLDLRAGRTDRAVTALRNVVALQYDAPGQPWHGTFPVTAEQAEPPPDAVEWFHYDPNWRQFLGTVLLVVLFDHGASLPTDLVDDMWAAVVQCAEGEPPDRIPEWYTNPNLLHAWVQAHAGHRTGDTTMQAAGLARARRSMSRLETTGDVDEYNSPTYDGVDLLAAALWGTFPPSTEFADWGATLARTLCDRVSTLFDPGLAVVCGPYSRAYGIDLGQYVSLLGLWLHVAGAEAVLPVDLSPSTHHVHDLFFLPLVERLSASVELPWALRPVDQPRLHVQTVGEVTASSLLQPGCAVGWADGPVPVFATDQYVPFTVHLRTGSADVSLAARPAAGGGRVTVVQREPGRFEVSFDGDVRWCCSVPPDVDERGFTVGLVRVTWSGPSAHEVVPTAGGGTDVVVRGGPTTATVELPAPSTTRGRPL